MLVVVEESISAHVVTSMWLIPEVGIVNLIGVMLYAFCSEHLLPVLTLFPDNWLILYQNP